jgi:hypothetical protein
MICAITLFLMAHQRRRPVCAVVIGALVKNNGVLAAPLVFFNGAPMAQWRKIGWQSDRAPDLRHPPAAAARRCRPRVAASVEIIAAEIWAEGDRDQTGGNAMPKRKRLPQEWVIRWGTEHEINDARDLICSEFAEEFSRALDRMGWAIVPHRALWDGHKWPVDGSYGYVPTWADDCSVTEKPALQVIKGGKDDDA